MDVRELRHCFGKFATGVTIVTFKQDDEYAGITVNSFTSVSLDPPLVLVSIDRKARAHEALKDRPFTVNILAAGQEALAWQFAGRPQPNLTIDWAEGGIAPRFAGALAYLECEPWQAYDGGDHTLFLGRVVDFSYRTGDTLGFFGGKFHQVADLSAAAH